MNSENIIWVRRLDLNTVLYSGSAYQAQGSSAAGHWIKLCTSPEGHIKLINPQGLKNLTCPRDWYITVLEYLEIPDIIPESTE